MDIPYYTLEKPRLDAVDLWTARLEFDQPISREKILQQIGEFAIATQNIHALITGYIEGDEGVNNGTAIVMTRDPHPEARFVTLTPLEYEGLAREFADRYGMTKVPYRMTEEFRVILGREPGYGDGPARPMPDVLNLLTVGCNSLTVQEGYFFSARYQDEGRWWHEPAAVIRGNLRDLPRVGLAGFALHQLRFVCETQAQALVYNKINAEDQEV